MHKQGSRKPEFRNSGRMFHGTTGLSLPNGISFRPTAFAGCTSVTDGWTDRETDRQTYGPHTVIFVTTG